MKIGIIGCGVVGGALQSWLVTYTTHDIVLRDPPKGLNDDFRGVDAIFISVPVPHGDMLSMHVQDERMLQDAIEHARFFTKNIFIRSSVVPGGSDRYKCIAMPEFLTARRADQDFADLPILLGSASNEQKRLLDNIFPHKQKIYMTNIEAELAKYTHNCFGALKVTYFNAIYSLCETLGADFNAVKKGAFITGFVGKEHTMVPGPDGKRGYGGMCFPTNIKAFKKLVFNTDGGYRFGELLNIIDKMNTVFRGHDEPNS